MFWFEASVCFTPSDIYFSRPSVLYLELPNLCCFSTRHFPEHLPFVLMALLWRCPSLIQAVQTELCTVREREGNVISHLLWLHHHQIKDLSHLAAARRSAHLLNINDVSQFNDFVPFGVGAFKTKVTGEIDEIQLNLRYLQDRDLCNCGANKLWKLDQTSSFSKEQNNVLTFNIIVLFKIFDILNVTHSKNAVRIKPTTNSCRFAVELYTSLVFVSFDAVTEALTRWQHRLSQSLTPYSQLPSN